MRARRAAAVASVGVAALTSVVLAAGLAAGATPTLVVDRAGPDCSDQIGRSAALAGTDFCTIGPAVRVAKAGDVVLVRPGSYPPAAVSAIGTAVRPITLRAAAGGVVVSGARAPYALSIVGARYVDVSGLELSGGRSQAVWIDDARRLVLRDVVVRGSAGSGVQIKDSAAVTIDASTVSKNGRVGIQELTGSRDDQFLSDHVIGNGRAAPTYDGDGIQFGGLRTVIRGCSVLDNGQSHLYSHGIYAAAVARGYLISGNVLSGNSGSDVKAMGSGRLSGNVLGSAVQGLYVTGTSGSGVQSTDDVLRGRFANALVVDAGARLAATSDTVRASPARGYPQPTGLLLLGGRITLVSSTFAVASTRQRVVSAPNEADVAGYRARGDRWTTPNVRQAAAIGPASMSLAQWQRATRTDATTMAAAG